jgi:hypothetical protein
MRDMGPKVYRWISNRIMRRGAVTAHHETFYPLLGATGGEPNTGLHGELRVATGGRSHVRMNRAPHWSALVTKRTRWGQAGLLLREERKSGLRGAISVFDPEATSLIRRD